MEVLLFNYMKILVTGGAGNIGGSLCRVLAKEKEISIDIIDNFLTGSKIKLPNNYNDNTLFINADINNYENFIKHIKDREYDYIFHYAAVVGVKRTLNNPKLVLNDIEGIKNILELAKLKQVKRVFFSSSSEVYGEPVEIPQIEATTPLNSKLPYAVVKNLGESYFRAYQKEDKINYTIFRFFNTYGPLQSEDFVITKFIKQAINNIDLTIYGDGSQTRTFLYVDDNINATIKCMKENKFINDVLNIGSDLEISILDLAKLIINISGSKSKIKYLPPLDEGDMTRRKPDITKMNSIIDNPLTSLENGIKKTIDYIKNSNHL